MARSEKESLRALLGRQAREAAAEALRTGGRVPPEEAARLNRLARLVEIHEAAEPPPPRKRWPIAAVLVLTLAVVSLLLFARVAETEIELDLTLSEVSFVLPTQQQLTGPINVPVLRAAGLREVRLPRARDRAAQVLSDETGSRLHLTAAADGERRGSISLAELVLPAGTRVWIRPAEAPQQYRLSLLGSNRALRVSVYGPVETGAPVGLLDFGSPREVLLQPDSGVVDLDLTLPDPSRVAFAPLLEAAALSFFHVDESVTPDYTLVRRLSSIDSGTLYLESLSGTAHPLRVGQVLQFEDVRGEIRTLRLEEDHVALQFHGRVRGMRTGTGEAHRSLMPTYLEWLQARHGLSLLWGTTLYLFGLAAGLLRWWGVHV